QREENVPAGNDALNIESLCRIDGCVRDVGDEAGSQRQHSHLRKNGLTVCTHRRYSCDAPANTSRNQSVRLNVDIANVGTGLDIHNCCTVRVGSAWEVDGHM